MRVIQVNKFHFVKGGSERYYFDLSTALRDAGHQVDHLAMDHIRNEQAHDGDRFVPYVDYSANDGVWKRGLAAFRVIYDLRAARLAASMSVPAAGAVAHLHNISHQLSPSVIWAFSRAGIPIVQTLHDFKLVCPAYTLLTHGEICERCKGGHYFEAVRHRCLLDSTKASAVAMIEAYAHRWCRTYDRVARFLCPSRFLLEKVAAFGIARERLIHLPYFVPADRYVPRFDRPAGSALYFGRLSAEKGVSTLIDAMALLPTDSLRLQIVGEGPLRPELEAQANARCPGRVEFLGYCTGDVLHETIRRAAFAVVPSEWYENFPYAVLESFALGTPVIGAEIGGIPELVEDGRTGCLHRSGDPASLRDAMLRMISADSDAAVMGKTARSRIESEYSTRSHMDRLLQLYNALSHPATP